VLSWLLYGILVVQIYFYYVSFPRDRILLKITVYGLFGIDTFQNVLCFYIVWSLLCGGWGRPAALEQLTFAFNLIPPTCGIVSLWVQLFYIYRIYVLGRASRIWKCVIVVIFLVSVMQALASLYVGAKLFTFTLLSDWHRLETSIGIWNVGSTISDVLIALSMAFLLTNFKKTTKEAGHQLSNVILNRLIRHSVESGALTAIIVLIDTGVIYGKPNTTLFTIFAFIQTKAYTNSLLASLNARSTISQMGPIEFDSKQSTSLSRIRTRKHTRVDITQHTETFGLSDDSVVNNSNAKADIELYDLQKPHESSFDHAIHRGIVSKINTSTMA